MPRALHMEALGCAGPWQALEGGGKQRECAAGLAVEKATLGGQRAMRAQDTVPRALHMEAPGCAGPRRALEGGRKWWEHMAGHAVGKEAAGDNTHTTRKADAGLLCAAASTGGQRKAAGVRAGVGSRRGVEAEGWARNVAEGGRREGAQKGGRGWEREGGSKRLQEQTGINIDSPYQMLCFARASALPLGAFTSHKHGGCRGLGGTYHFGQSRDSTATRPQGVGSSERAHAQELPKRYGILL
ncbi:hypothetical protein B0H10DRAFT_1970198 [Mycena sp. CBHHK59/15]|nr:hypothetical protein B0H10DRAFT_1970198 [Mycena sp. CBHHK59/15]